MDIILKFLIDNLNFLYLDYGFKFIDSGSFNSFGGDGYVSLEGKDIQIRIVSDRDQLFLEFRSIQYDKVNDWHTSDIVYQLIANQTVGSSVLDVEVASNIKESFDEICQAFNPKNAEKSIQAFKKLELERSKRMFS